MRWWGDLIVLLFCLVGCFFFPLNRFYIYFLCFKFSYRGIEVKCDGEKPARPRRGKHVGKVFFTTVTSQSQINLLSAGVRIWVWVYSYGIVRKNGSVLIEPKYGYLNCIDKYISTFCHWLISLSKNVSKSCISDGPYFFVFIFRGYVIQEAGVSPVIIVDTRAISLWTGNWIVLKNTSPFCVI